MSVRRRVFCLVLAAELVCLAPLLQPSSGSGGSAPLGGLLASYVMLWALLGVGFLNALVAALPRPRWTVAVVTLAVHAVAIAGQVWVWQPGHVSQSSAREQEREDEAAKQARWAAELTALVVARRSREALAYVDQHPMMVVGDSEPFRAALCPADGGAPDYPLLLKMGERGAPSGGSRLVASAGCSLQAFRALMEVSQRPATDTSDDGQTALMTAREPALLEYLLAQGLDVNARDARGRTALMSHRSAAVTRFLLEHGADAKAVDKQGYSVLHFGGPAQELGEIFELLLAAGANPNQQADLGAPLHHTVGPLEAMECLARNSRTPFSELRWSQAAANAMVRHGASVEQRLVAISCCMGNDVPIEESLRWPDLNLAGPGGAKLLVGASRNGREHIPELIEAGANPLARNEEGESGLEDYEATMRPLPGDKTYALMRAAAQRYSSSDAGR